MALRTFHKWGSWAVLEQSHSCLFKLGKSLAKSGFEEEPMDEAYLKRSLGVHGIAAESVLAFLCMKSHRDNTTAEEEEVVCVIRWREKPVCLAKLPHYQKHQNHYNAIEKSKIMHLGKVPAQVQYIWSYNASGKEEQNNWFICNKKVEGRDITRVFPCAETFPKVLRQLSISKAITAVSLQSRTTAGAWHTQQSVPAWPAMETLPGKWSCSPTPWFPPTSGEFDFTLLLLSKLV